MEALVEDDKELIERTGELADEDVTDEGVDELIELAVDPQTNGAFDEMVLAIESTGLIFKDMLSFVNFSLIDFNSLSRVSKRFSAR